MTSAQERKKQERGARRRLIQEAAREIFATKGYAKTSIEQVAQGASLSVGAIYLYFRSKEDLYLSLIEAPLTELASELTRLIAHRANEYPSPLHGAWARLLAWATNDPEGVVILRTLAQPEVRRRLSSEVTEAVATGLRAVTKALESTVVTGVESGHYRPVDPVEISETLWSLFVGVIQSASARQIFELTGPSIEQSAQWALDAVLAGIRIQRARVAEAA